MKEKNVKKKYLDDYVVKSICAFWSNQTMREFSIHVRLIFLSIDKVCVLITKFAMEQTNK